jgi:hypothetical protein
MNQRCMRGCFGGLVPFHNPTGFYMDSIEEPAPAPATERLGICKARMKRNIL